MENNISHMSFLNVGRCLMTDSMDSCYTIGDDFDDNDEYGNIITISEDITQYKIENYNKNRYYNKKTTDIIIDINDEDNIILGYDPKKKNIDTNLNNKILGIYLLFFVSGLVDSVVNI